MKNLWLGVALVGMLSCGSVDVSDLDPTEFSGTATSTTDCTTLTPSFATDVLPIFSSRGCSATACHSGSAPGGNMNLDSSIGTTAVFTNATSSSRVNTVTPSSSPLVRKPLGLDSHGGSKIYDSIEDDDYITTLCWITNGATNN